MVGSDLMYADDPGAGQGMEEVMAVRGQKVTLGCTAVDENAERFRNMDHNEDIQTVRWFHNDKEVRFYHLFTTKIDIL